MHDSKHSVSEIGETHQRLSLHGHPGNFLWYHPEHSHSSTVDENELKK